MVNSNQATRRIRQWVACSKKVSHSSQVCTLRLPRTSWQTQSRVSSFHLQTTKTPPPKRSQVRSWCTSSPNCNEWKSVRRRRIKPPRPQNSTSRWCHKGPVKLAHLHSFINSRQHIWPRLGIGRRPPRLKWTIVNYSTKPLNPWPQTPRLKWLKSKSIRVVE